LAKFRDYRLGGVADIWPAEEKPKIVAGSSAPGAVSAKHKLPRSADEFSDVHPPRGMPGRAVVAPNRRCSSHRGAVITLGKLVMILELHRQGVSAIARQLGIDRKTVLVHIAEGLAQPTYKARPPRPCLIAPWGSRALD
jgi:hypothetical protein